MEWLAPVNLDNDLARRWGRTTKGTNRWFLQSSLYTDWRDGLGDESVLWLSGSAGIGKSILAASIVQDLRDHVYQADDVGFGYFFFDSSDNRKSTLLEASATLIAQLTGNRNRIPPDLLEIYERAASYGRSMISLLDKPMDIIANLLKEYRKTYLVLDGIDESAEIAMTLREILGLEEIPNVRILFVGRETLDTKSALSKYTTLKLMPALVRDDIDVFLRQELSHLAVYFEQDDLVDLTFNRLSLAADGSFLWAHLMVQTLRKAPNVMEFLSMTTRLPSDLESIYRSTLQSLEAEPVSIRDLGENLLCWVCFAMRPLRWKELQHALCFDPNTKAHQHDRLPFKNSILRLCNPLLEYDAVTDEFRPVHWSVCEFLARGDSAVFRSQNVCATLDTHSFMLQVCLCNLRDPFVVETVNVKGDRSPLVEYATLHWCDHLLQAEPSKVPHSSLSDFILVAPYRRTWIARYMLLQIAAFPLQTMLEQLRKIHSWLVREHSNPSETDFDLLEDMFNTIFVLATSFIGQRAQGIPKLTSCFAHFERMMVVRDLARAYTLAGRISDALQWLHSAIEKVKRQSSHLTIESIWLLNSLGIMYDQQKEFGMSVDTQLEALDIQRRELPPEHLDIVWTMNELGRVYRHLWLLEDAEKMHMQALSILNVQFKESDPQIIWTKSTLGRTYRFQGRFIEALTLHQQVLKAQVGSVGEHHCHTLWTMSDIARCLRDQGKLLEALQLLLEVVKGRTRTLGELHADTLWSVNDVGLLLTQCGRRGEAKAFHEKALRSQISSLGEEHEQTTWTRRLLAEWVV
jgi:tetratricopeptide (TPR) repeat protein